MAGTDGNRWEQPNVALFKVIICVMNKNGHKIQMCINLAVSII